MLIGKRCLDINDVDPDGNTLLHIAIFINHDQIAKFLIDEGANFNLPNHAGKTAKMLAEEKNNKNILALMNKAEP